MRKQGARRPRFKNQTWGTQRLSFCISRCLITVVSSHRMGAVKKEQYNTWATRPGYEPVFTVCDYHDGPRGGVGRVAQTKTREEGGCPRFGFFKPGSIRL